MITIQPTGMFLENLENPEETQTGRTCKTPNDSTQNKAVRNQNKKNLGDCKKEKEKKV